MSRTAISVETADPAYSCSILDCTAVRSTSTVKLTWPPVMPHRCNSSAVAGKPGISAGTVVGDTVGTNVLYCAAAVGENEGSDVCRVGDSVAIPNVGAYVGGRVGDLVERVGVLVGRCVGTAVVGMRRLNFSVSVGMKVGDLVGTAVGATLQRQR